MKDVFNDYLNGVLAKHKTREAGERSYYPLLEHLFAQFKSSQVIIEPRNSSAGIPDFKIETPKGILVGYIEAKDLGRDLDKLTPDEQKQIKRYVNEYPKIVVTNFIEFRLYENGEIVETVLITQPVTLELLTPVLQNEGKFTGLLERFFSTTIPEIRSTRRLAELLAHKTHVLKGLVREQINLEDNIITSTEEMLLAFRKTLSPQMTEEEFADMYAQTVTFGLFTARLHSGNRDFNRISAIGFIPQTIPLLKKIFWIISGQDVPQYIEWQVDEIAEILANTKIEKISEEFFTEGKGRDPIIHFYETFLAVYDPKEREKRGVYYTPLPVVSYITKSVNWLLKDQLGKKDGFADSSVLVLDPAAGTLTFPAEAIAIARVEFTQKYGEGSWPELVREHILKDFYAFELLMAPYAVGHLKISLLLKEMGYDMREEDRFKLYLTNTLEMEKVQEQQLFMAREIAEESEKAYEVKQNTPVLVVMGNPPYSGISENKGKWISEKIEDYKYIEGEYFDERKHWLQDDYVKFFRFAQWKIDQAGQGVLGFITNHAWLDNPTFRGMRYSLLKSFDEIYVVNLHGSTLKKETTPEGGRDENVFDIQAGVAITIGIKYGEIKTNKIARVFYADKWGLREEKYGWLENNDLKTTEFTELNPAGKYFFFVPRDETGSEIYGKFISVKDIFNINSTGIVTARDGFVIDFEKEELERRIGMFTNSALDDELVKQTFGLKDTRGWKMAESRKKLVADQDRDKYFTQMLYRPFDVRWVYYTPQMVDWPRTEVMNNMLKRNLALVVCRQLSGKDFYHALVTSQIVDDSCVSNKTRERGYVFPLYLYSDGGQQDLLSNGNKVANLNFEKLGELKNFSPEEIFYYIYAVLYSNIYREKYQEFLKIDFPRVPFTKDSELFRKLSGLGEKLVSLHLMKAEMLDNPAVKFRGESSNLVEKREYKDRRIYINEGQYFEDVSEELWKYYIGGYQVLDKWLKDRKGRRLSAEDTAHYCRIATVIGETIKIQREIDEVYPEAEKSLIV